MKSHVAGLVSCNSELHGAGFGEMSAFLVTAATMNSRQ